MTEEARLEDREVNVNARQLRHAKQEVAEHRTGWSTAYDGDTRTVLKRQPLAILRCSERRDLHEWPD